MTPKNVDFMVEYDNCITCMHILYFIILYYIVLYCIILYSIILYYIILYYIILYYGILYYIISYYIISNIYTIVVVVFLNNKLLPQGHHRHHLVFSEGQPIHTRAFNSPCLR